MPNCPVCKESRILKRRTKAGKLVAKKIVALFSLTPRLQRMFNNKKHIAKWKLGMLWTNVRLGLAADGFNPFGMMSQLTAYGGHICQTYNNHRDALLKNFKNYGRSLVERRATDDKTKTRKGKARLGNFAQVRKELWLVKNTRKLEEASPKYSFTTAGRQRCVNSSNRVLDYLIVEEALEQALSLFEFWGFSSFNGWKLVHVVNGIKSVTRPFALGFEPEDSFVGERYHDMVYKLEVIGQGVWLFGPDILKKPSEKHGIRKSHFATLSHTYHSMSDIVSKIEVFANGETIEHVAQGCIGVIFVTGEASGIFTNDDTWVPFLCGIRLHESKLDLREVEDRGWGEDHNVLKGMRYAIQKCTPTHTFIRNFENLSKVFESKSGFDIVDDESNRESSNLRIETGNASLRRAFRQNDQRPLTIGFDYGDLGTFHPTGDYASMLNSLMGETVRYLPLACEWEEIPEAYKAHIFPTLESYFDLASWYNNQDKVVMGNNVYTVGDRVKLGLQLKLRILWRKNKQRIKADHFTRYGSAEEARNHLPPKKVWGDRTEDEWNNLVDWWSHPDRVARSLQNAANRAKNTILTHQGKKSFAQGRNEYKVQKGHYEDLIETWRKTHSRPETGEFKTEKNRKRYLDMKSMQDQVRAGVIPYKTDQDILDEVVPSTNRQNMSGKGRKLPGGGSTSRRRGPQAFPDAISREELDRILRQKDQEAELLRKQTAEAQQRAYLAALKADAAYQNSETMYGAIGEYFSNYAPNPTRPFMPPAFARPTMPQLSPEWAHLLNPPFPYNQPLQPSYAGPSQYTGPPGYTGTPRYTAPLQPLQPPYVGQFPFTPVNNNTFNNCYHPVMNSNLASTSYSQPELPRFITNPHNNDTRSVDELARDKAGEDNDVREDNQQSGGDYSEDEEGDNEEVQDESEESD
ncbi:acidic leucine-rich nuclear phosphoprotein 32 family member A [Tanacetum coccineum]|uniref:Acidic leucine-rich nuclear phosphoprotein 32 family member A n=1 Tax=Tanacetum coccineum TaxID=301880 RepID=A0ABQ4YZK6_9ASTR